MWYGKVREDSDSRTEVQCSDLSSLKSWPPLFQNGEDFRLIDLLVEKRNGRVMFDTLVFKKKCSVYLCKKGKVKGHLLLDNGVERI